MALPSLSAAEAAEQLYSGHHWSTNLVTYSFPTADPGWEYGGFSAFSEDQQAMAELVLGLWADVADIAFAEPVNGKAGQIRFYNLSGLPFDGQASYPGGEAFHGDVRLNPASANNLDDNGKFDTSYGGYAFLALLHEVGHALGLDHPSNYDADPSGAYVPTYLADAQYAEDTRQYTVMSYFDASWTGAHHETVDGTVYASTPLLHDIYAIQQIYGANMSTRETDTVYGYNATADRPVFDFSKNPFPVIAIWDTGGIDTLDLSGERSRVRIDLNAGAFSDSAGLTGNIAIAHGTQIENAIGGDGDDEIVGNLADNLLRGGDGDDRIQGAPDDHWLGFAWAGAPGYVLDDADEIHGEAGKDSLAGGWGDDLVNGGADADDIDGGPGDDTLNGGSGADFIVGDAGADEIHGASGDDVIYGHRWSYLPENPDDPDAAYADADRLYGGDGDDVIYGGYGDDWIDGDGGEGDDGAIDHGAAWSGDDTLFGEAGMDTIFGGDGADTISGGDDADHLYGEGGADILYGDRGDDELRGGDGADSLMGSAGQDTLYGEAGDDWLHGGADQDIALHGGAGIDTVSYYDETDRWRVDLAGGLALNQDAHYDEIIVGIENLELGSGNDTAFGTDGANVISGGSGNDRLEGRGGDDTLRGGAGNDTLLGQGGADLLDPGSGNDTVDGGSGMDTVTYASTRQGVTVDLVKDQASGSEIGADTLANIESAIGGAGNDRLYGDNGANRLEGGAGRDTLAGLGGNDTLIGGADADRLMPGIGNDVVDGGAGVDTVDYSDTALSWYVELATGTASAIVPGILQYLHSLTGIENVTTGPGNDTVRGDDGANVLTGNGGDDSLHGGAGDDHLHGGEGDDTLIGHTGDDQLFGGPGADTFAFFYAEFGSDIVYGFEVGTDLIELTDVAGFDSFEDLVIDEVGGDTVIVMGPNSIVLAGLSATSIGAGSFVFA